MMKLLSRLFFKLNGWKVDRVMPPHIKKCIMVAAPHTSNYDFFYARAALYIMRYKIRFLIKQEWMKFPTGLFFKAVGGVGVERSKTGNLVKKLAKLIRQSKEIMILIAPEGTRKVNRKWKTGFYYAALEANVPIALTYLDYKKKIAGVGLIIHPSGNFTQDMQKIKDFYKNITPKHPAKFVPELY